MVKLLYRIKVSSNMRIPVRVSTEELVSHLTKPAKTDVEKLRCLVRWMSDNIRYNVDIYNIPGTKSDCSTEGVLKSGKAVCEGYSNVVDDFCRYCFNNNV